MSPALSFCITSLKRHEQIVQTLPRNLHDNELDRDIVDFVLVDFNQDDALHTFVLQQCADALSDGYLKYYRSRALPSWHASVAKNTAHALATGTVLVNLDGDNFTGPRGGRFVLQHFFTGDKQNGDAKPLVLHQLSGDKGNGTFGRIACRRSDFWAVNGYDQSFAPMGAQDVDLMRRLQRWLRVPPLAAPDAAFAHALRNNKKASVANCVAGDFAGWTWERMVAHNRVLTQRNAQQLSTRVNEAAAHIGVAPHTIERYDAREQRMVPLIADTTPDS